MHDVVIRFTTHWPPNPTSPIIAHLSGSRDWSHSMAIIDGLAYEATMLHGCRVVPVEEAMRGVACYQDMPLQVPDVAKASKWGLQQDGKPYDYAGAFGIPFLMSEDWSDDRRWWCSEMNFMQLGVGGLWLLDPDEVKRVTPNHLRMCNFPKSPVIRL